MNFNFSKGKFAQGLRSRIWGLGDRVPPYGQENRTPSGGDLKGGVWKSPLFTPVTSGPAQLSPSLSPPRPLLQEGPVPIETHPSLCFHPPTPSWPSMGLPSQEERKSRGDTFLILWRRQEGARFYLHPRKRGTHMYTRRQPPPYGVCFLTGSPPFPSWPERIGLPPVHQASLVAQMVKCLPAMWETQVWPLGWEDPLEKEMETHSSTFAWKIPWTEEPGRLQSMGSQRVGRNWVTSLSFFPVHQSTIPWLGIANTELPEVGGVEVVRLRPAQSPLRFCLHTSRDPLVTASQGSPLPPGKTLPSIFNEVSLFSQSGLRGLLT